MVHPYINAGSGFYCLGCTMSYSRCLSLSALLASTFISPVTALDLTGTVSNGYFISTHTYTPIPEPVPSFADMSHSYETASICFLGVGDCDPNVGFGKGDEDYTIDTAAQCRNEGFVNSCSSGYCMDGSCSYNASYGKCIAENCPTNSSPTCTGAVVGKTACGGDCKQCCSDTCASGSKSYTGSYASTTECGNKCYYCNTSCSSGSTSYTGSVVGYNECGTACKSCSTTCSSGSLSYTGDVASYNECGSACRYCDTSCPSGTSTSYSGSTSSYNECGTACKSCSTTCPSGYSLSNPGGCYDTTTNECGNTCYKSKACCSDTCSSGSKYYSGSYASTTECGSTCYYCSNSCPSGSTSYSGSYAGSTECGSSCYYCSSSCSSGSTSISCSSGYTKTSVGSTECGSTCYECVKDDPCDNYTSKTCDYGCASYYSDCPSKCSSCKSCSNTCSTGFRSHADYIGTTCNNGYGLNVQVGSTECGSPCLECDSCANSSSKGVACNGPNDHCTQTGTCGVCTECITCGCNSSDSWGYYTYSGGSNCTKINQAANFESACGSCYYCRY